MSAASRLVERDQLRALIGRELQRFVEEHPGSRRLFGSSRETLLRGVPMSWMSEWHTPYPVYLKAASGAVLTDVDENTYVDFCLGDTGAFAGHGAEATWRAVEAQYRRGATAMLPTEDAAWVAGELKRRFGLPIWQFSLTATDANRWVLRLARELSGRGKILVFNGCYHGTVDETVISLSDSGRAMTRPGNIGAAFDPTLTTEVVEFNDVEALERSLASGEIACVLTEPALTNAGGIIPPDPGFHEALRDLTGRRGTYLVLDETQTFPTGPGGYTGEHGLKPDFLTVGKAIAGGVPLAAYGMREEVANAIDEQELAMGDIGAVGGTLAGNALSLAAARATLGEVLTDAAHVRMNALGARFADGVEGLIKSRRLPWHIVQIGSRLEYHYLPEPPRDARQAFEAVDNELDAFLHLYLLNRGVLLTPFHNMALISPDTDEQHIGRHTEVLSSALETLGASTLDGPARSDAH